MKKLFFLLPHPIEEKVFVHQADQGWALPVYNEKVFTNVSFDNPHQFNAWFRDQYGIEVFRRYAVDSEHGEVIVFALEIQGDSYELPEGCAWAPPGVLEEFCASYPMLWAALQAVFDKANHTRTIPCSQVGGYYDAIDWMLQELHRLNIQPMDSVEQIKNAYVSSVLKCHTDAGAVYLKVLPDLFVREFEVTRKLAEWGLMSLPRWLASDSERKFILLEDMGGHDLSEDDGIEIWKKVMKQIAGFQIDSIPMLSSPPFEPFYDWRFSAVMKRIDSMVLDVQRLFQNSPYQLSDEEAGQLATRLPHWKHLCADIESFGFPNAIDHGDLRPGNIRIVPDGMIFYDWAWSSIAHPFISATLFLHVTRRMFSNIPDSREILRDAYLEGWQEYGSTEQLRSLFDLVYEANMLYATIADAHWLRDIKETLDWQDPPPTSADAWLVDRRQYYLARVVRRLL